MNVLRSGRTAGTNSGLAGRLHQQQGLLLRGLRVRLSLYLLNLLLHLLRLLLLDGDVGRRLLQLLDAGTVGSITGGKDLLRLLLLLADNRLLLNGKLRLLWKLLLRLEGGPSDGDDVCGRSGGNDLLQLLLLLGYDDLGLLNDLLYDLGLLIADWKHARIGDCRRRRYITNAS